MVPERVTAFGQSHAPSRARLHRRDRSIEPATDDWPFLYLRDRHVPRHYLVTLGLILLASVALVAPAVRRQVDAAGWHFFLLGMGFMLLETKSITQFALLWGSTWVVASLAIASVLVMALAANFVVSSSRTHDPALARLRGARGLLAVNYFVPVGPARVRQPRSPSRSSTRCSSSARSSARGCCSAGRSRGPRPCRATTA